MTELRQRLPEVRGAYREKAALKKTNWFGVGGPAEVLFKPADVEDLAAFMKGCPPDVPVTVIGVGSNLIVRDGGLPGVVIRLGRGFTGIGVRSAGGADKGDLPLLACGDSTPPLRALAVASDKEESDNSTVIEAGAAAMDVHVARVAAEAGLAGLEFLSGIPGTIGGALAMNGGAYGAEMKDVLVEAELVLRSGEIVRMTPEELHYSYRHSEMPEGAVFTRAWMRGRADAPEAVLARMEEITRKREATQPIRERTGGSTFKNPSSSVIPAEAPGSHGILQGDPRARREDDGVGGHAAGDPGVAAQTGMTDTLKAWQLIDAAGCRGLRVGGAQMSELHCNFMINTGEATAADLEALGEEVRRRVKAHSGVELQWEIKRIGRF